MSASPDVDSVLVERRGPVAILTLNRPDRLNALSHGLLRRWHEILDDLLYDYSCRVVVVAGAGRAFCAGMDLNAVAAGELWVEDVGHTQGTYALQEAVGRLVLKLRKIPQPVISVVHGVAAGGGLSIACAADVRIGEPAATFNPAFSRLGVSGGDMGSSWLLPRVIGFDKAAEMLLTARDLGAEEALELGLLGQLVPTGAGLDAALEVAGRMCEVAPFTSRMTKSLLNLSRDGATLEQMIEMENRTQVMMTATGDFREATSAFVERRSPRFRDH